MIDQKRIQRCRLMIVDDQESNVILLERMLEAHGFTNVLSTTDPNAVDDLYYGFKPDLILLDLHMPGRDGFAVMENLKEGLVRDYLPVLVLTADVTRETKIRALEAGAKDFITKPFDQIEVMTRIRNMLEVRLYHADLRNQNAVLEEKVRERTRELRETRLEIIHRLGRAAEFRDEGTGLHLMRISQFSHCLSKAAGLPTDQAELILSASPMHDIGKIGIPDRILLKAGKLDEEEWAIMKTHTTIGADLLAGHDSSLMKTAAVIALTHHERWDGMGYPQRLKAEGIPLEGRIVALCDVFDALLSRRPYKEKWPLEAAVRQIDSESGGAFDPFLVTRFHEALAQIQEIFHQLEQKIPADYRQGL